MGDGRKGGGWETMKSEGEKNWQRRDNSHSLLYLISPLDPYLSLKLEASSSLSLIFLHTLYLHSHWLSLFTYTHTVGSMFRLSQDECYALWQNVRTMQFSFPALNSLGAWGSLKVLVARPKLLSNSSLPPFLDSSVSSLHYNDDLAPRSQHLQSLKTQLHEANSKCSMITVFVVEELTCCYSSTSSWFLPSTHLIISLRSSVGQDGRVSSLHWSFITSCEIIFLHLV